MLCGEVFLPIFLIGEVLEGGEGNDTRIQPNVTDLSYSFNCTAALGTLYLDLVDPGAVEMRNCIDLGLINSKLVKLFLRAKTLR